MDVVSERKLINQQNEIIVDVVL